MFIFSVGGIGGLEMSHSNSNLQWHIENCLYERVTAVKSVFSYSNYSDSGQSNVNYGDIHKTEKSCHFLTRVQVMKL